tara:strand:- start:2679 stop:3410 length:732 start_codon:yes stop_codon:yes gene_type:complete
MHILLCDDQQSLEKLDPVLTISGYSVLKSEDGISALREFLISEPELVITNLKLQYMDGLELTRRIRERSDAPIIGLSDTNDVDAKIEAFNAGVTDFLLKPVYEKELLGRVDACLLRLGKNVKPMSKYEDDLLLMDFVKREVKIKNSKIDLTRTEYNLLSLLVKRNSQALSLEFLLANVWGREYDTFDLVKWHISNLRKKIRKLSGDQNPIVTVRGYGYIYDSSEISTPKNSYDVMSGYRNKAS